jgi:pyruvate dehydrogenase E2 component (dihydrolipoamide acetyltransferase)
VATPVELPQLGNTVEECLIAKWLKHEGDAVAAGDVVAEVETDKTTFEVTAPVSGILLATFFDEGAIVPVFTKIFVIGEAGENIERPSPRREIAASQRPLTASESSPPPTVSPGGRAGAYSPRASRFAAEHHFKPEGIVGTGPGGRVLESDLRRAYEAGLGTSSPATGLRPAIARRMRESLSTTAQYTLNASADATALVALRALIKSGSAPELAEVTINSLVTFCTIRALADSPDLNAEYVDGRIVRHADIHLAFAVDTPRGLLAPVVRGAHRLSIVQLAQAMKRLSGSAISGTIAPDDLSGGTFTVSNLGHLGIESFTPIVNAPQVAILGVGALQPKPVRRDGLVSVVDVLGLSLTCDHQAVDGAPGARFLQILRERIERLELAGLMPSPQRGS